MNSSVLQLIERRWESQFFGKNIAELLLNDGSLSLELGDNQYDIIQTKINATDTTTADWLQQCGFRFVEGEIHFALDTLVSDQLKQKVDLGFADITDIPALKQLVATEFRQTRFREPFFNVKKSQEFYQLWIERAVLAEFDDVCLVVRAEDNSKILGAISLKKINHMQAKVGLIVVAREARGRGIATQLIDMAQNWCCAENIKQLHIATQTNNLPAIALYQKSGAVIREINYWFYWMNSEVKNDPF